MHQIETTLGDLERAFALVPDWIVSLAVIGLAAIAAAWLHGLLFRLATRMVAERDLFWRSLVSRTRGPTRLGMIIVGVAAGATLSPLSDGEAGLIRHGLLIAFIALMGWVAMTALHIWTTVYLRRFKLESDDNLLARKHITQSRILQRVAVTVIFVVTLSAALMTVDGIRQYGVSLLASAGAAGIVVGLALQPILKNLVAGIQLAITQPIRIDDALLVEGEFGNVEEITATYVVVRLWDLRRMILPLGYFIEHPFQNWTREGSALLGSVLLQADYSLPVPPLRAKLAEILAASPNWDGKVKAVQVTDFKDRTMEVRLLMSAATAGRAFDLRCEVREQIIAWLQAEHPTTLPRLRAEIDLPPGALADRTLEAADRIPGAGDRPAAAAPRSTEPLTAG